MHFHMPRLYKKCFMRRYAIFFLTVALTGLYSPISVGETRNTFSYNIVSSPFTAYELNGNPLIIKSFDDNATLWYSFNQYFNSTQAAPDSENIVGRLANVFFQEYTALFSTYLSHEVAHEYQHKKLGNTHPICFDFSRFWAPLIPMYNQKNLFDYGGIPPWSLPSDSQNAVQYHKAVDGLNQNQYNANFLYQKTVSSTITLHESLAYFENKLQGQQYVARVSQGNHYYTEDNDIWEVVEQIWHSNNQINIGVKKFFIQMAIADYLSYRTYESVFCIIDYLGGGNDTKTLLVLKTPFGDIVPPNIAYYVLPKGVFYNATLLVDPQSDHRLEISLGMDADFIGGDVNALRFGGKMYNLFSFNAYGYLNSKRTHLSPNGYSVGLEKGFDFSPWHLLLNLEYNDNDIIENTVKDKYSKNDFLDNYLYGSKNVINMTMTLGVDL